MDSSANTLVFAHGWSNNNGDNHWSFNQWSDIPDTCNPDASDAKVNPGGAPESCPPTDYDPRLWTAKPMNTTHAPFSVEDMGNPEESPNCDCLDECQGDCDSDNDCMGDLKCWHRNDWDDAVPPGCSGSAHEKSHDYCYRPNSTEGWNVIHLDWRHYADADLVEDAQERLYSNVDGYNTVIELLFDKLIEFLDMTAWDGPELRIVGHSLGGQVALGLSAQIKTDSRASSYKNKLTRIALLDSWFSNGRKSYLPQVDVDCSDVLWKTCQHMTASEFALEYLLRDIRGTEVVPVIESYRTSLVPTIGDGAEDFYKRTVFTELKPWFYGSTQLSPKHNVAVPMYMHCQKWRSFGQLDNNAPSCRMSTADLQKKCPIENWRDECAKRYEQVGDDGAFTTPDYDDSFEEFDVATAVPTVPRSVLAYENYDGYRVMVMVLTGLLIVSCAINICILCRRKAKTSYAPVKAIDSEHESDVELII